jgi:hypothetical protein
MRIQIVFACVVSACLFGCSEDPNDKAARQFRQQTSETLDKFAKNRDPQATGEQLEKSLSRNRAGGLSGDSVSLVAADMRLAKMQLNWADLQVQTSQLSKAVGTLNQTLERLADNTAQNQRIQGLLALSDAEIVETERWIGSDPNTQSLKGQLAEAQTKEKQLLDKKTVLRQDYQKARDTMLELDAQADQKLRQAQTAAADKQAELEKAGFDLKSQKKEYYLKAQQAENLLAEVNSDLDIVQPHLKRLQNNLRQAEEKLQGLKTSSSRDNLQKQRQELNAESRQQKNGVKQQLDRLVAQLAQHNKNADEIISSVNEIIEKYQKVNPRQLEPNVSMSMGQACALAGAITAAKVYTASDLGLRLEGILRTYETVLAEGLSSPIASKPDIEMTKKAMAYFDQAAQFYQQAASAAGQLRGGAQKAACAALKGQLLAVNSKIRLADRIEDFETAEKTQLELDKLVEKAKEYGPLFSQSATATLLTKGIDFTPMLPVDSTMVLEGIKKDFVSWRKLHGTAAETEVQRLLTRIQELRKEYPGDEQITQFLDQELQAMEQAKAKGFAEEEAAPPADANEAASPADANNVGN